MEEKQRGNQDEAEKKIFMDEISVRGRWIKVPTIEIDNKRIIITGKLLKTAKPKENGLKT